MFKSQIDSKPILDAKKFDQLLELVNHKVRDWLSNVKPEPEGYKTAWERLKTEYGQKMLVIAVHTEEIIKLPTVKGRNYDKVCEFYKILCKNYDALQTLGEDCMLKGLVVSTLNKLPQVKPDLVRIDDDWEDWDMKSLLKAIQGWLKRNKMEEISTRSMKPQEGENDIGIPRKEESLPMVKARVFVFMVKEATGEINVYESLTKRR